LGKIPKVIEFTCDAASSELSNKTIYVAHTAILIEFKKLYKDVHIGTFTKFQRLRWIEHLQFMDDTRNTKKIYQLNLHYKRPKERPKVGWKDDVQKDT
jgi:hypothetical protein